MLEDTFSAEDLEPPGRPGRLESWKADRVVPYPFPTIGLSDHLARSKPYVQEIPSRSRTALFLKQFFPGASIADWNDWRWQLRHRIVDIDTLGRFLHLSDDERAINEHGMKGFPMAVTPYYLSLLNATLPIVYYHPAQFENKVSEQQQKRYALISAGMLCSQL